MNSFIRRSLNLTIVILALAFLQVCVAEEELDAEAMGQIEFIDSCSLCHGVEAKGDGVFASMLTVETPDLTKLRQNNGGTFPYREVYLIIDGRDSIKQHGPRHMPIWGERFSSVTWFSVDEDYADTLVRGTIFELLLFLDSIQEQ